MSYTVENGHTRKGILVFASSHSVKIQRDTVAILPLRKVRNTVKESHSLLCIREKRALPDAKPDSGPGPYVIYFQTRFAVNYEYNLNFVDFRLSFSLCLYIQMVLDTSKTTNGSGLGRVRVRISQAGSGSKNIVSSGCVYGLGSAKVWTRCSQLRMIDLDMKRNFSMRTVYHDVGGDLKYDKISYGSICDTLKKISCRIIYPAKELISSTYPIIHLFWLNQLHKPYNIPFRLINLGTGISCVAFL